MTRSDPGDASQGYEAVAREFMSHRSESAVGVATVRRWSETLPDGGAVLDLGCGHGVPISRLLIESGFDVHAVDASPSMAAAFRSRFPKAPLECASVESSSFFGHTYDGVVAWGLMFLLAPDAQASLIRKVAGALRPGGRFLFTAPRQACEWPDAMTGARSVSLGVEAYRRILEEAGLTLTGQAEDEGENHYYFALRPGT